MTNLQELQQKKEQLLNERCKWMLNLYNEGITLEEIGKMLEGHGWGKNISKGRVSQIFSSQRMEKIRGKKKPTKKDVDKMIKLINKERGIK